MWLSTNVEDVALHEKAAVVGGSECLRERRNAEDRRCAGQAQILVGREGEADQVGSGYHKPGGLSVREHVDPAVSPDPGSHPEPTLPVKRKALRSFQGSPVGFGITEAVDLVNDILVGECRGRGVEVSVWPGGQMEGGHAWRQGGEGLGLALWRQTVDGSGSISDV